MSASTHSHKCYQEIKTTGGACDEMITKYNILIADHCALVVVYMAADPVTERPALDPPIHAAAEEIDKLKDLIDGCLWKENYEPLECLPTIKADNKDCQDLVTKYNELVKNQCAAIEAYNALAATCPPDAAQEVPKEPKKGGSKTKTKAKAKDPKPSPCQIELKELEEKIKYYQDLIDKQAAEIKACETSDEYDKNCFLRKRGEELNESIKVEKLTQIVYGGKAPLIISLNDTTIATLHDRGETSVTLNLKGTYDLHIRKACGEVPVCFYEVLCC